MYAPFYEMTTADNDPVTGPPIGGATKPAEYVIVRLSIHVITAVAIASAVESNADIWSLVGDGIFAANADFIPAFSVGCDIGIISSIFRLSQKDPY